MTRAAILAGAASVALFISPAFGGNTYSASSATGSYKGTPMPYVMWNGMYLGVNGGGAWGTSKDVIFVDGDPAITANAGGFEPSGGFGGGQIGYNWQSVWAPGLVLGIETDFQAASIYDRFSRSAWYYYPTTFDGEMKVDFFGTVRGRVGMATGSALIFGTGGIAYGGVHHSFNLTSTTFTNELSSHSVGLGVAAGAGLEYRISPLWSVKAEYQYIGLESQSLQNVASDNVTDTTTEVETGLHTVRIGFNYFVNPSYWPLD